VPVFEVFATPGHDGKTVAFKFQRMGEAAVRARPAMEVIAGIMLRAYGMTFESQGRRGGGSWKRDSVEWLERKQRMNLDLRIGHATGALRRAMSVPGAAHQKLEIGNTFVHLSTDIPYAATEQRHRPFLRLLPGDKLQMRHAVRDYLIGTFKAAQA
jgi:phage gpG-like protein